MLCLMLVWFVCFWCLLLTVSVMFVFLQTHPPIQIHACILHTCVTLFQTMSREGRRVIMSHGQRSEEALSYRRAPNNLNCTLPRKQLASLGGREGFRNQWRWGTARGHKTTSSQSLEPNWRQTLNWSRCDHASISPLVIATFSFATAEKDCLCVKYRT